MTTKVVGDYRLIKRIGKGSFAEVYFATNKNDQKSFAIKVISKDLINQEPKLAAGLESEVRIMREFLHPNIVQLHKYFSSEKNIYLVLDYCAGGDLHRFIRKEQKLSEPVAMNFLLQIATGLQFLHSKNYIHRDLKPANVLLTDVSETAVLKIADFGFARLLENVALAQTRCGTPLYMAPEILEAKEYNNKADVWSVGCILFEMLTGSTAFKGSNEADLLRNIRNRELRLPDNVTISDHAFDIISKLLERNPTRRMSIDDLIVALENASNNSSKTFSESIHNSNSSKETMTNSLETKDTTTVDNSIEQRGNKAASNSLENNAKTNSRAMSQALPQQLQQPPSGTSSNNSSTRLEHSIDGYLHENFYGSGSNNHTLNNNIANINKMHLNAASQQHHTAVGQESGSNKMNAGSEKLQRIAELERPTAAREDDEDFVMIDANSNQQSTQNMVFQPPSSPVQGNTFNTAGNHTSNTVPVSNNAAMHAHQLMAVEQRAQIIDSDAEALEVFSSASYKCSVYCDAVSAIIFLADKLLSTHAPAASADINALSPKIQNSAVAVKEIFEAISLHLHALWLLRALLASLPRPEQLNVHSVEDDSYNNNVNHSSSQMYLVHARESLEIWRKDVHACVGSIIQRAEYANALVDSLRRVSGRSVRPKGLLATILQPPEKNASTTAEESEQESSLERQQVTVSAAEKLMWQSSLAFERDAALEEMQGNLDKAVKTYSIALRLARAVSITFPSAQSDALSQLDAMQSAQEQRRVIDSYCAQLEEKIRGCQEKMTALGLAATPLQQQQYLMQQNTFEHLTQAENQLSLSSSPSQPAFLIAHI